MSIYLGIDYGEAHLGFAYASSSLATPLPPLPNNARLLSAIATLVNKYSITAIVLGLPEGRLKAKVISFASTLGEATHLPVYLHDETLTTHDALAALRLVGAKRQKLKNEHSYAAAHLLDDYLDMLN